MPASNLADLLNYEEHYEDAIALHLRTVANVTANVFTPRTPRADEEKLVTPRVEVVVAITGTGSRDVFLSNGSRFRPEKQARVACKLAVQRDTPDQNLGLLRGQVRAALLEHTAALTNTTLPYYQTVSLVEAASDPGSEPMNDELVCVLGYDLTFHLKGSEWPTG